MVAVAVDERVADGEPVCVEVSDEEAVYVADNVAAADDEREVDAVDDPVRELVPV